MTLLHEDTPRAILEDRHRPTCDFCNADASVVYHARPTSTDVARAVKLTFTRTDWRACEACRTLIASGLRDDLAERGTNAYIAAHPLEGSRPQRRAEKRLRLGVTRRLHDDFWRARLDAAPIALTGDAATQGFVIASGPRPEIAALARGAQS